LREAVFDVVQGGIDKHTRIVPSTRFDADGLMDQTVSREVLVGNGYGYVKDKLSFPVENYPELTVFAHQSHQGTVTTPDDIFNWWAG